MRFQVVRAIIRKDVLSLAPFLLLVALLYFADAIITRLDLLPLWSLWSPAVLQLAMLVIVLAVFQLDSPASVTDDWLCRPIRIPELLLAKFILVIATVHLSRAIGVFAVDVLSGFPMLAALQDALLLPHGVYPFLVVTFLFAAIVTRTFVQGFGVLFVIFICVFVIPTPFVRPPGPLAPGIHAALLTSGMQWISVTPAKLVAMALLVSALWLVYWRRNLLAARVLLGVSVVMTVFFLVLPMGLAPWTTTFAVQKSFGAQLPGDAAHFSLHNPRTCFPAARRAEVSTDGAFLAASRGMTLWGDEELEDVGPDSVAFITAVEPRGLPLDWRVKVNYVDAVVSGGIASFRLRPADYITDHRGSGALRHAWMLPQGPLLELRGAHPRLELLYSLTMLKPREFALSTDGMWQVLPELGVCRAKPKAGNEIDVECFTAYGRPAQLSAELDDIPATRAFSAVDFSPVWMRWAYANRVKLTIGSARLARHDSITVTSWEVAGYIDEAVKLPGILGAEPDICPLPGGARSQQARWRDSVSHEAHSISVDDGVQLEVLDFGGAGSAIVLLPGLGATAHSYDDLGPPLARHHRVIAITRRGTGYSSRPDFGFDTPRLGHDVLTVMDQMNLGKVLLVGHSIAGEELTWLGGNHGERFTGLVYLDAAYDRAAEREGNARYRELLRRLPPEPPLPPTAFLNQDAMSRHLAQRGHLAHPEGEIIAFFNADKPHLAGTPNIDSRTTQAIRAAIQPPDYGKVKIPALAIYAIRDPAEPLPPWYDASDPQLRATLAELRALEDQRQRQHIEGFRGGVENGQVLEIPKAKHYLIQSNPREVREAIEKFAARLASATPGHHDARAQRHQ